MQCHFLAGLSVVQTESGYTFINSCFEKGSDLPFTFLESLSSSTIAADFLLVVVFLAGMIATLLDFKKI